MTLRRGQSAPLSPARTNPRILWLGLLGVGFTAWLVLQLQVLGNTMLLMAVAALCLGGLVVIRPEIGLVVTVLCAAVVKVSIGTGTNSPIVASLLCATLLICGWIAHRLLHRQRLNLLPGWLSASIFALVGFTMFSWIWGSLSLDPRVVYPQNFFRVQMAQAALFIVSTGLLFVGADIFRNRRLRNIMIATILVVGALDLFARAILKGRLPGILDDQTFNTFGLFGLWLVTLAWSQAILNDRLSKPVRLALVALTIGWLAQAILVDGAWISGWLPGLIGMLIVSFFAGPRFAVPFLLLGSIVIAPAFAFFYDLLVTTQKSDGSIGGDFGRLELWQRNLEFSQDWLLFGSGPAGYVLYYVTFIPEQAMSTHSNYVDILSQLGIGGLLSLICLLVGLLVLGVRVWPRLSDSSDRALCAAVVGGLPGLMIAISFGDWLIPFVYNQTIAGFNHSVYSWLVMACLCGLIAQHLVDKAAEDG